MKKALRGYRRAFFHRALGALQPRLSFGLKLLRYENFSLRKKLGWNYFFFLAAPFLAGAFFLALDAFFLAAIDTSSQTLAAFDPGSLRRALPQSTATPPLNASHHRKVL
jgi:hypothetical protein